jgi:hypothetical protein
MNDERLNKLFAAARAVKPDTSHAEYGFETRLRTRLRAGREQFAPWYAWAWKLIPALAVIVVASGVWMITAPGTSSTDLRNAITGDREETTLVTYLTGDY